MRILVTNDDGIHAPGLQALADALSTLGDVSVVAPERERSGVSQTVTFLTPLAPCPVDQSGKRWAVNGSPADCVKWGALCLMERQLDLVVSGINGGQNAGINTLYSGTVGAAVEGVLNGYTSIAVSLAYDTQSRYTRAAEIAVRLIEQILRQPSGRAELYNINIPLTALECDAPQVVVVPTDTRPWGSFERRTHPRDEYEYYWLVGDLPPHNTQHTHHKKTTEPTALTDIEALRRGFVTVTPLTYDRTHHARLGEMRDWVFD